jgi:hypothetical protein
MPPVFYPTCKVRLQVRLESFVPEVLVPQTFDPFLGPEAFGDGLYSEIEQLTGDTFVLDLVPYNAFVELNSYRLADSATLEVPFARLPLDPRIIRAMTVQVFGGTFDPLEFAAGMAPTGPGLLLPDAVPLESGRPSAGVSNELFRGFADLIKVTLTSDGKAAVRIEARDSTGPLLDAELPPNALRDIPMDTPLDVVIMMLLTGDGVPDPKLSRRFGLPGYRGISVVNETGDGETVLDLPTLKECRPISWLSSAKTVKKARRGRGGGNGNGGNKITYWDLITDLCVNAGYTVLIRQGTLAINVPGVGPILPAAEIVITNPRTYYGNDAETGEDITDLDSIRTFIYGVNIKDMEIERKLTGTKTPSITVSAFDIETGKLLRARFPPLPVKTNAAVGTGDREEVKQFTLKEIGGPKAQARLDDAAKSIYEQLGRGEMRIKVATRHLAAFVANHEDGIEADLFQLRAGDSVRIEVARANFQETTVPAFTLFSTASPPERIYAMMAVGIPKAIAARISLAMDSPFLQTVFRVTRNALSFDHMTGWDVTVEAVNYLDVRSSVGTIESGVPSS